MQQVGIEALNVYGGVAKLDLQILAEARQLDKARFDNLLMKEKTVAMPYEDPVSYAVGCLNSSKPVTQVLLVFRWH